MAVGISFDHGHLGTVRRRGPEHGQVVREGIEVDTGLCAGHLHGKRQAPEGRSHRIE